MVWYTHAETVSTSAVRLIPFSPRRTGYSIRNRSSSPIYIGPDTGLTTANGLPIEPGETRVFLKKLGFDVIYEVYIIGDAGSQNIRIREELPAKEE